MKVREPHATCGQTIEDGGLHRTSVAAEVAVAEIVDEQRDDVGLPDFRRGERSQQQ